MAIRDVSRTIDEGIVPPHDLDAEGAVLSAVMIDPAAIGKIDNLKPEHFFAERHRRIYEACIAIHRAGQPVDNVTVGTWLKSRDRIQQVGGMGYLTEILNAAPAVANVAAYASTVIALWQQREAIATLERKAAELRLGRVTPTQARDEIDRALESIAPRPASAPSAILDGPAIAAPLPPLEYLVRELGLVAGGGAPHLVAGYGFSGKTLALQSMALSLVAARAVWGGYTVTARRVVHVDLEQGERLTRLRYQRLARAMGLDLASLGDALALADMPPIALTVDHVDAWRALMTTRDVMLVDSLRAASAGLDENDSAIRAGLDLLGRLSAETGCRPIVIHHARKQGKDDPGGRYAIRGSSAIFDGCDAAYLFSAEKGEPVRVEHVKARSHGALIEDIALVISDVAIDGDAHAGLRVQAHGAELVTQRREEREQEARRQRTERDAEAVKNAIAREPGIGSVDLRRVCRISGDRLADAVAHLGHGIDVREEPQGRTRVRRHYLGGAS
jgi:hypothetical protein